jgi:hypothetical protein
MAEKAVSDSFDKTASFVRENIQKEGVDKTVEKLAAASGESTLQSEANKRTLEVYESLTAGRTLTEAEKQKALEVALEQGKENTLENVAEKGGTLPSQTLYQGVVKKAFPVVVDGAFVLFNSIKRKQVDWWGVSRVAVCGVINFTAAPGSYGLCSLLFSAGELVIPLAFQALPLRKEAGNTSCYKPAAINNMQKLVSELLLDMNPVYWGADGKAYYVGPMDDAERETQRPEKRAYPLVLSIQQVITSSLVWGEIAHQDVDNPYWGTMKSRDDEVMYGHWWSNNPKINDRVHFNTGYNRLYQDGTRYLKAMRLRYLRSIGK